MLNNFVISMQNIFIFIFPIFIFSQTKFPYPIDTVDITGNFGEVRNNHFHQGIDFSTKGIENYPVKSIDDGYVYRLKISSEGYGKVIYIHHPSGILTVYAHLNQFAQKIQSLVENYQIQYQVNEFDIKLPKDSIKIKQGEIIGFSGNTGSSYGPHLHFEIRDELTEIPINPLFYFNINDTVKPVLQNIFLYDLSDTIYPHLIYQKNQIKDTLYVSSVFGVGISAYDKTYATGNPNNVYKVQIFLDSLKIYQHRLHYISFDNTIYAEYFSEKFKKQIIQKCFTPHLYPPYFYDTLINKGKVILSDTNFHTLQIYLFDEQNNYTTKTFIIKAKKISRYKKINTRQLISCTKQNVFQSKYFEMIIPEKSIYQDINAKFIYNEKNNKILYTGKTLPLRYPAKLIIHSHLPKKLLSKALLFCKNKFYTPDTILQNKVVFSVKILASCSLYIDTTAPFIKPLYYNKKTNTIYSKDNKLYFKLKDNADIKDYKVYFNQQFCISYYDKKNNLLITSLPKEYIYADTSTVQIIVTDIANNKRLSVFNISR